MQIIVTIDVPEWVCKTLRVEDNTEAHAWVDSMVARITPEIVFGVEPAKPGISLYRPSE